MADQIPQSDSAIRFADLAQRALAAIRRRDRQTAWLLADKLCRLSLGPAAADALLLRSTAFAILGDRQAALDDLHAAAHADPTAPAVNRALLASSDRSERIRAARRLLLAATMIDQHQGFEALSREGFACVGVLETSAGRLHGRIAWQGPDRLPMVMQGDGGDHELMLIVGVEEPPPGFAHAAQFSLAFPAGSSVVKFGVPGLDCLFEPATLLAEPSRNALQTASSAKETDTLLIIIPVYSDLDATIACFESLRAAPPETCRLRIIAIDDTTPEPALADYLDVLAAAGEVELLRNRINLGFAGSVNRALSLREPSQDVLILNADTIIPTGAIDRLAQHIRATVDVGTVTPLSNNGEDTSFSRRFEVNPLPDHGTIEALNRIAGEINRGCAVDMPNGVGFCLYVRGAVLDQLGFLSLAFGRGYYEDVEFCLRAAAAGWRNVCAVDVYVGHHGGRSFGKEKRGLVARNLRRLAEAYPAYRAEARRFEKADPLREPIGRIEEAMLREAGDLDLLIVPHETPAILTTTLAGALKRPEARLLFARQSIGDDRLSLRLTADDDGFPQNIIWEGNAAELERMLVERLSALPIRQVTLLASSTLAVPVVRAVSRLSCPVQSVPTGLSYPDMAELTVPRLSPASGVLAVIGLEDTPRDVALLAALNQALRSREDGRRIVVAGNVGSDEQIDTHDIIFVSGPIDDDALPQWLTRLGPAALFFASSRWSMSDPRAALWAEAGLKIARFDGTPELSDRRATDLILSPADEPTEIAAQVTDWFCQ